MTQEEMLRRMEAIVADDARREEKDEKFREEMREDMGELKDDMGILARDVAEIKAEIRGAGGIVGRNICIAHHAEIDKRIGAVEEEQKATRRMTVKGLIMAIVAFLGACFTVGLRAFKP